MTAAEVTTVFDPPTVDDSPPRRRIRALGRVDEGTCVQALLAEGGVPGPARERVEARADQLVKAIRGRQHYAASVNALLNEFSLSSREGVVLMCLAEALLRVPDKRTADRLIRDKIGAGDWRAHLGHSHSLFVNASAWGLLLTGKFIELRQPGDESPWPLLRRTVGKAGEPAIRAAMRLAMRIVGTQFVLGTDITEAGDRSAEWLSRGYRYTYDMLGEAARTGDYARAYFESYCDAIAQIGRTAASTDPVSGPGFSIKLSALHPRYELAHLPRLRDELAPRVLALARQAMDHGLGLTIDAEEAHRLEPMLEIFQQVYTDPSLRGWEGFGIAVQAYLRQAPAVIDWLAEQAAGQKRTIPVRLVKGAYWDAEIKLAQTLGYSQYPVFTRKASSDLSYLACARRLLERRGLFYPQFATHNAHSAAAVIELAGDVRGYEFQRLHGMGEELYEELVGERGTDIHCRIYAPVGAHRDLLAYLVRRLLENGANDSFVHRIADEGVPSERLAEDPARTLGRFEHLPNPGIPQPVAIYAGNRRGAAGVDLADIETLRGIASDLSRWQKQIAAAGCPAGVGGALPVTNPARRMELIGHYRPCDSTEMDQRLASAHAALPDWAGLPPGRRADIIRRVADQLESRCHELAGFCIREAGKTLRDAIADVREAVDFCRYYADQAEELFTRHGETLASRGVVLCISPWNFPVAIFSGQVCAALAAGNTVLAKPAEQTTLTGSRVVALFHQAGVPRDALQLLTGPGEPIGARLLPDQRIAGVMFTGSTEVARDIARTLAEREGERVPLLAETGGQNAMVVDSTALLEKVVDDVIASGFNSAGQRCSALRLLLVQEEAADPLIDMLVGAMRELRIGDPADPATDIGPIIDEEARARLEAHVTYMTGRGQLLHECALGEETSGGVFFAPRLYEIGCIDILRGEVFGPVVHLLRYRADDIHQLAGRINSTGYGLTFGAHSRIDSTCEALARDVAAGNVYVNRNIIGAVVGVQPFGGRGLSGTGPKAGGPLYLERLVKPGPGAAFPRGPAGPARPGPVACSPKEWPEALEQLWAAFPAWRDTPVAARAEAIAGLPAQIRLLDGLDDGAREEWAAAVNRLIEQAVARSQPVELAGPTGEQNTLEFEGRGVFACLVDDRTTLFEALLPAAATLLSGSTVLLVDTAEGGTVAPVAFGLLADAGVPGDAVALSGSRVPGTLEDLLQRAPIAGAACAGGALSRRASRALAEREGAILPLIDEPLWPGYINRFFFEKTVSINTAAAGGNAALLSQGELD